MPKLALLDGDVIAYRCAASCEPTKIKLEREPLDLAIQRADELCYRILDHTQASEYRLFLSGTGNFRKQLYPDYKANRERLVRPQYLDTVREFLIKEWKGEITAGYEADDGIGIAAKEDFIICSNDKDFKQIPGEHFNFVKEEFEVVDEETAAFYFWSHMLIGDSSDNVRGVDGIGPIKARRLLLGVNPEEMSAIVRNHYADDDRFLLNIRLLRVLRSEEEYANIKQEIEREEASTASQGQDIEDFSDIDQ